MTKKLEEMTKEEQQALIEELAIKSAQNHGSPEEAWVLTDEGHVQIYKNKKPIKEGVKWYKKFFGGK